ncbi:MAG: SEC-C domain-containing protein [Nitrosomonas sp.]|nr:SEC-C domain-containing protein [Nitrosomonas sp.]
MDYLKKYKYKFYYVEDEKRIPDGILNANAFNEPNSSILSAAKSRLAIFLYHYNIISNSINSDKDKLFERTTDPKTPVDDLSEPLVQKGAVAIYDGVSYQTALHGLLYSLKSFLDVFAFFVAKYLHPEVKGISFGKGKVDGEKISGGSLINWLKNSKFDGFEKKDELAEIVCNHSRDWINEAIKYRDDLTHRTNIDGFVDMHVVLEATKPYIKKENIKSPSMPNNLPLNEYADATLNHLINFIKQIVEILPNVDLTKLNYKIEFNKTDSTAIRIEYDDGKDKVRDKKISRNAPCHCGSGKRYKECHGKLQ